jgi:hypothetical protein
MKKTLGVLVLTLSSLVLSAACASSGASSKPKQQQQPDSGENWVKAAPSELPSRPANAAAVQTARLASR